jgi:hypothetical protein
MRSGFLAICTVATLLSITLGLATGDIPLLFNGPIVFAGGGFLIWYRGAVKVAEQREWAVPLMPQRLPGAQQVGADETCLSDPGYHPEALSGHVAIMALYMAIGICIGWLARGL